MRGFLIAIFLLVTTAQALADVKTVGQWTKAPDNEKVLAALQWANILK